MSCDLINLTSLRMANTLWSFEHSECNRVKFVLPRLHNVGSQHIFLSRNKDSYLNIIPVTPSYLKLCYTQTVILAMETNTVCNITGEVIMNVTIILGQESPPMEKMLVCQVQQFLINFEPFSSLVFW